MNHRTLIIQNLILATLLTTVFAGCRLLHKVEQAPLPSVEAPAAYTTENQDGTAVEGEWWKEFKSEELDSLMDTALDGNLDIRQAWNRLAQAQAVFVINRAGQLPSVQLNGNRSENLTKDDRPLDANPIFIDAATQLRVPFVDSELKTEFTTLGGALSYELDIWGRVASLKSSAKMQMAATYDDVQATAFVVSGSVMDSWLAVREQVELLKLVREQLEANKTQLELLELRLGVGQATALDVLQQRQQLAATEAEIPTFASVLDTSQHRLEILLGRVPRRGMVETNDVGLPNLVPLPKLSAPADLLNARPDLRAARRQLVAADHEVASAIADRLPRITFSLSYDFRAEDFAGPFNQEIQNVIGSFVAPIFEGGRRRAEVTRRRAIVEERLNRYTQVYLNALLEVENALTQEMRQGELLQALQKQTGHAKRSLQEARARYLNGLNDYLPVLTALQTVQRLERRLVSERRRQLTFRANLYRALGGRWTESLSLKKDEEETEEEQQPVE